MKRFIPDSVAGRTFLVLLLGLVVSHALSMGLYVTDRASALMLVGGEHVSQRIVTITRLVEKSAPNERRRLVELTNNPTLYVTLSRNSPIEDGNDGGWQAEILRKGLIAHFGNERARNLRIRYTNTAATKAWIEHAKHTSNRLREGKTILVSLPLADSSWLNFTAAIVSPDSLWSIRFVLSIVVMMATVGILSAFVVYHLTAPLRLFARAAQRLGVDVHASPMKEAGPVEVRRATRAFNEMQRRIRRFVEDRTQMIAAISHDLRTPITRMRLRAEFVEDEKQQRKMLADLDEMEGMITATLTFARNDVAGEPREPIDMSALLQSLCDDMADAGLPVQFSGQARLPYNGQPIALKRAFTNLVDNAVKYGERAQVELFEAERNIVVQIDDEGPGIPDNEQKKVFAPFYRLDRSRSRDTGGVGLGLAFARSVIRAHGGDIKLVNRSEGGLRVVVTLPR